MGLTEIKTSGIADDAITLAKQAAGTDGQIITYDANGNPVAVGPGTDGQVLTSTGAGSPPAFEDIPAKAALTGSTDNTICTVTGANAIQGEANLTFDGSKLTVTGQAEVSSDLDIASDIRHIGDTNTKIRFPAADTITAETDGNEAVRVDSDGHVQIGSTGVVTGYSSSGKKLTIYKADGNGGVLELGGLTNADAYNAGTILFNNAANSNGTQWQADSKLVGIIRAETITTDSNAGDDSGADLVFYTKPEAAAGFESMKIHGEGHVTMKKMPYCKYHPGADDSSNQSNGTEHVIDGGSSTVTNGMACDTSNGRITVPYDGIYQINANIGLLTNDDTHRSRLNLMVNGADIQRTEHTNKAEDGTDNTDGGWKTMNIAITLALSASDYISFDCVGKHDQQTYTIITVVLLHGN